MTDYFLSHGKHKTAKHGRCAMEWVAYLAGEPHSDSPVCVCPVLTTFCIGFNDALPDGPRQKLRPYLARTIGTRGDGLAGHRSWLAADWLIRTYTPAWLALAGLDEVAERLRSLPPVLATENLIGAMDDLRDARREAAAVGAAVGDAVGDAVRAAVWDAARAAVGDAAWDAAWDAARDAVGDALQPTVEELQRSAFGLLDRMLPTEAVQLPVVEDAESVCGVPIRA